MDTDISQRQDKWNTHRQKIVDRFLRVEKFPDEWTMPFVPWCGAKYWRTSPKILYVGKSVGIQNDPDVRGLDRTLMRWKAGKGKPDPRDVVDEYVTKSVGSLRPASPNFWLVPLMMTSALVPEIREARDFVNHIAWSNIYKTCRDVGNGVPTKNQLMKSYGDGFVLRDQCANWLIEEVEILKPDIVLLGIGSQWRYFAEYIAPLKQYATQKPPFQLPTLTVRELKLECEPCIWVTYHFSAWTATPKDRTEFEWNHGEVIADLIRRCRNKVLTPEKVSAAYSF